MPEGFPSSPSPKGTGDKGQGNKINKNMLYLIELDSLFSIIMIIVYTLYSLKNVYVQSTVKTNKTVTNNYVNLYLNDVYFFSSLFPLLFVIGYFMDSSFASFADASVAGASYMDFNVSSFFDVSLQTAIVNFVALNSIDVLLAVLLMVIIPSFASFESVLLLLFAFIGSYFMLHSVDLLTFYIALEAQNFCFLVLSGLGSSNLITPVRGALNKKTQKTDISSFSVEATLKYFLLSAFSSGVILFWFSNIYLQTGLSVLDFKTVLLSVDNDTTNFYTFQILCAMMFKLGAAPLHLWVVQIYSSVKRSLLMYISTVPKLALFGFWVSSFHSIWTDYSVVLFALFSIVLGSLGAYGQPALRSLFAYSTVNEIGIMLMAVETAGFHSLFQHLTIYIISQLLLWNMYDKRFFPVLAVSLAGLPPLAGFFGKAWIFWHVSSFNLYTILIAGLLCTGISLVYYLRVLRLFWNSSFAGASDSFASSSFNTRIFQYNNLVRSYNVRVYNYTNFISYESRVFLTSTCMILLIFIPLFLIKPFVL
jgi:NADH:ubiquinone oxidoreductase subunit 2 (subunit N)